MLASFVEMIEFYTTLCSEYAARLDGQQFQVPSHGIAHLHSNSTRACRTHINAMLVSSPSMTSGGAWMRFKGQLDVNLLQWRRRTNNKFITEYVGVKFCRYVEVEEESGNWAFCEVTEFYKHKLHAILL
jgi:hypothetical protein